MFWLFKCSKGTGFLLKACLHIILATGFKMYLLILMRLLFTCLRFVHCFSVCVCVPIAFCLLFASCLLFMFTKQNCLRSLGAQRRRTLNTNAVVFSFGDPALYNLMFVECVLNGPRSLWGKRRRKNDNHVVVVVVVVIAVVVFLLSKTCLYLNAR